MQKRVEAICAKSFLESLKSRENLDTLLARYKEYGFFRSHYRDGLLEDRGKGLQEVYSFIVDNILMAICDDILLKQSQRKFLEERIYILTFRECSYYDLAREAMVIATYVNSCKCQS